MLPFQCYGQNQLKSPRLWNWHNMPPLRPCIKNQKLVWMIPLQKIITSLKTPCTLIQKMISQPVLLNQLINMMI